MVDEFVMIAIGSGRNAFTALTAIPRLDARVGSPRPEKVMKSIGIFGGNDLNSLSMSST